MPIGHLCLCRISIWIKQFEEWIEIVIQFSCPSLGEGPLYLPLGEVQVDGDLVAAEAGQVVVVGELGLQLPQLLLGERRALFAGLAAGVHLEAGLLEVCRGAQAQSCLTSLSCMKPHSPSHPTPHPLTWPSSTPWRERVSETFSGGILFYTLIWIDCQSDIEQACLANKPRTP